ncbi:hypothetical protein HanPI659440_Chr12g0474771 [Helianthus annuus]|nr:hypothetical protein HanPI659440_Chr12g0474771 [Helianthus annuus]
MRGIGQRRWECNFFQIISNIITITNLPPHYLHLHSEPLITSTKSAECTQTDKLKQFASQRNFIEHLVRTQHNIYKQFASQRKFLKHLVCTQHDM